MVHSCSAINCTQRYEKGITFHRFPKDPALRRKWVISMRRDKWKPSDYSSICSRHFENSCYDTSPWASRKHLKVDAIPTVFDFPEHLQKSCKRRNSPKKRRNSEVDVGISGGYMFIPNSPVDSSHNILEDIQNIPPTKKKRLCYIGDFNEQESSQYSNEELIAYVRLAKKVIDDKNQKIKTLRQKTKRLEKKIISNMKEKFQKNEKLTQKLCH